MKVVGGKEGKGNKGYGIRKEGGMQRRGHGSSNKCNDDKGGGQTTATLATAIIWAMATTMRPADKKEGKGKGGKGNGNGDVRVVGKEEG
jgi:hypothetical protein